MTNWTQLTSGGAYDFDDAIITGPFTLRHDLAQPLANIPRFAGHLRAGTTWSVAHHSVCVARTIQAVTGSRAATAAGLLHDAHEAIIGDIPTPVAWHIGYEAIKELKAECQSAIHYRLSIPENVWPESFAETVKAADQAALLVEKQLLLSPEPRAWTSPVPETKWMLAYYEQMNAIRELEADRYAGFNVADLFCEIYAATVHAAGGA